MGVGPYSKGDGFKGEGEHWGVLSSNADPDPQWDLTLDPIVSPIEVHWTYAGSVLAY